jgi:hypothetical protein
MGGDTLVQILFFLFFLVALTPRNKSTAAIIVLDAASRRASSLAAASLKPTSTSTSIEFAATARKAASLTAASSADHRVASPVVSLPLSRTHSECSQEPRIGRGALLVPLGRLFRVFFIAFVCPATVSLGALFPCRISTFSAVAVAAVAAAAVAAAAVAAAAVAAAAVAAAAVATDIAIAAAADLDCDGRSRRLFPTARDRRLRRRRHCRLSQGCFAGRWQRHRRQGVGGRKWRR